MREKVELLIDEFVDEILANSQFYHESGRQQYHPRYIAVSKFINKLIFGFDQLTVCDATEIQELFMKMHRENYNSIHRKKLIFDREWVLRQFEIKLFGDDGIFRAAYEQLRNQKATALDYEVDFALDDQLAHLLSEFEALGVKFNKGDIWQIGQKTYHIEGYFAKSDLWLQHTGEDGEVIRLRELLPLGLGDFYQILNDKEVVEEDSYLTGD